MTQVARRYLSDLKLGGKWIPMPSSLGIYVNVDEFFTWTPLLIGSREITEWFHYSNSRSSQCSTTGVTKAVVCAILYVGWCI